MENPLRYQSLKSFYPFYLSQHLNLTCRVLHFIGTTLFFVLLFSGIYMHNYQLFWFMPVAGYGFAWVGHFFFEKNKPATFQYPLYSLLSDFGLYFELLLGREKFKP
jgi:hypothetical protein